MVSTATILICILAAPVAGLAGYYYSYVFYRSEYAAMYTSGDLGAARVFETFIGITMGLATFYILSVSTLNKLPGFPQETADPAIIVSMIVGLVAAFIGMFRGRKNHKAS